MTATPGSNGQAARIRQGLNHPIVDSDGHILEFMPVVLDYVKEIGGPTMMSRFEAVPQIDPLRRQSIAGIPIDHRRDEWIEKAHYWIYPSRNTLDRATAHLPALLSERLEAIGLDHLILYPTDGLLILTIEDDELRQVAVRAFNTYFSELLAAHRHQMTPVALIPMQTPEEALDELDYAIDRLGFKAAVFQQMASRTIPKAARENLTGPLTQRIDYFGIDSEYDYDVVWEACIRRGIAVTFHGVGTGFAPWRGGSVSNHVINRLGGAGYKTPCAAMILGGVTKRFPNLPFAFLEAGMSWANDLFPKLVSLWERRNVAALADLDPRNMDRDLLFRLIDQYGDDRTAAAIDAIEARIQREVDLPRPVPLDDFADAGITQAEDIADLFSSIYVGCEADDPNIVGALRNRAMPFGARLRPIFGSDIGHFDVPDMEGVLAEVYEPVASGAITEDDFRDFVFANAVRLHGSLNPHFFDGTTVEVAAAAVLERGETTPGLPVGN
jgi:predicted TIM-barrel fold metal-dependent hydrolase